MIMNALLPIPGLPGVSRPLVVRARQRELFFPETVGRGMRMSFIGTDGAWQGQGR